MIRTVASERLGWAVELLAINVGLFWRLDPTAVLEILKTRMVAGGRLALFAQAAPADAASGSRPLA